MDAIRKLLADHRFERLFLEELGWDRASGSVAVLDRGGAFEFEVVAQKRGFVVVRCRAHRTVLADRFLLRRLQKRLAKTYHEHLAIYVSDTPPKQVWQWLVHMPDARVVRHREHPFFSDDPPPGLLKRLGEMAFSLDEEESISITGAVARVRDALDTLAEKNLFARRPWYAKRSDELAMAMKRGEPGAFDAFVMLHQPLTKWAAHSLARWVGLGEEDALQIAMFGIIEAANRFDPDRGYQFSTVASYWLRQQCQRYGVPAGQIIRVPPHVFWPCYKLRLEHTKLHSKLDPERREIEFAKLRQVASVSVARWENFQRAVGVRVFSDLRLAEAEDIRRRRANEQDPRDRIAECDAQDAVRYGLAKLRERDAQVLCLRYGMGVAEHTLEEAGIALGVTRERVRQIQQRAERVLGEHLEFDESGGNRRKRQQGHEAEPVNYPTYPLPDFDEDVEVHESVSDNTTLLLQKDEPERVSMQPQWVFSRQVGSSVRRDPNEAQLFKTEQAEEGEYAGTDALVREVLQNSIDARAGEEPVMVCLALHDAGRLPSHDKLAAYFGRLATALQKRDVECDPQGVPELSTGFLVCEDFGTRGLGGDPLLSRDPPRGHVSREDFFYFWRNNGISGKTGDDLGRWGLGKTVYRSVSRIGCMLGLTVRQNDGRRLLMGQSVLSIHEHEGVEYVPEGYWCGGCNEDQVPMPLEDDALLAQFATDWRLSRTVEPGLSVVAPYVAEELRGKALLQAVTVHFFLPIVRGELVVEVSAPDMSPTRLDAQSIAGVCETLEWNGPKRTKRQAAPPIDFAKECEATQDVIFSQLLGDGTMPALDDTAFSTEDLATLRERFANDELAAAQIQLSLPRRNGPPEVGELAVFVRRNSAEGPTQDSYYVREGMTITKITSQASRRGVKGLVVVDHGPLAELLGDSEGPAHEDWDTSEKRPDKKWKTWKGRVKFVRRIVDSFVELLTPAKDQPDFDLLGDYFSLDRTEAPQRKNEPSKNGKSASSFEPIPSTPKWYRIEGRDGSFRIAGTGAAPLPEEARLRVSVAYDLPTGDPLKKWSEYDFEFSNRSKIKLGGKGVRASMLTRNVLILSVSAEDFAFSAAGFDVHRDLFVRVDEISGEENDEQP